MTKKPILILPIGLPRSGKTTMCSKLSKFIPVVNPDSVRLAIHGQAFIAEREPEVWHHVTIMVESLFRYGHKGVILDATNISRKDRKKWKSDVYDIRVIDFTGVPAEICKERAVLTGQAYLLPVIDRMQAKLSPPSSDERELTPDDLDWITS